MSIFNKNKNLENKENENKNIKPKRNFFKALLVALGLSAGVATLTTGCGEEKQKQAIEQEKESDSSKDNFREEIKVSKDELDEKIKETEKKAKEKAEKEKKYEGILKAANKVYEEKTGYDTDNVEISYIYQENAGQSYSYLWDYTDDDGKKVYVHNNYLDGDEASNYGLDSVEPYDEDGFPDETVVAIDKTHHEIMYGAYKDNDEYGDFIVSRYNGQSGESVNPGGDNPRNSIKISDIRNEYDYNDVDKDQFSKDLFDAIVEEKTKEQDLENER